MAAQERTITVKDEIRASEPRRKIDLEGVPGNAGNEMKCDCVVGSWGCVSPCVYITASMHTYTKVCVVCVLAGSNPLRFCLQA